MSKGAIHDLGYRRYIGTRDATSRRWRVIARHQIATAWKTWWRYKAALSTAVIVCFIAGGFMYFAGSSEAIEHIIARLKLPMEAIDIPLPFAISWFARAAFIVSLTVGASVIATDLQSGAFTFYFARSIRPRDYVLGKLAGYGALVALLAIAGPLLLAITRLVLTPTDQIVAHLVLLPKVLAIGIAITVVYTALPLGISALAGTRRNALAAWAAYYLIVGSIGQGMAFVGSPALAAVDLPSSILGITAKLIGAPMFGGHGDRVVPFGVAIGSIVVHSAVGLALLWRRVAVAQATGVGGGS